MGAFIGTYTFPSIIDSLGGSGTYGGDTVRLTYGLSDSSILMIEGCFLDRVRPRHRLGYHHLDLHPQHQAR